MARRKIIRYGLSVFLIIVVATIAGYETGDKSLAIADLGPIYFSETGHYYEAISVDGGITWDEAKSQAESLSYLGVQGHLATITSQAENDFIYNLIHPDLSGVYRRYWLGGFQPDGSPEPAGNWQWVTGETWSYTNWRDWEPNNAYGGEWGGTPGDTTEEALHFHPWVATGQWNDVEHLSSQPGFVVEYPAPPVVQDCPDEMVSYWKFDEGSGSNASDSVGISNGNIQGAVTWSTGDYMVNGALSFDGTSNYVEVPNNPSVYPSLEALSISAWIKYYPKPSTGCPNGDECRWSIVSNYWIGSSSFILFIGGHKELGLSLSFADGDGCNRSVTTSLDYYKWYHVAGVYDQTDPLGEGIILYIDGVRQPTTLSCNAGGDIGGPLATADYPLQIGRYVPPPSHQWFFKGVMDEVATFDRALTPEEIQQHYINGLSGEQYCTPAPPNEPPTADAGPNVAIPTEAIATTTLVGTATDEDPGDTLEYRWKEGETIHQVWQPVSETGDCPLEPGNLPTDIGAHTLTLEVSDGYDTASDNMILTIENSAPHAAPTGGGVYEIYSDVILGGSVSDFDGDELQCQWKEGENMLFADTVQAVAGGTPVELPVHVISDLSLGVHIITLQVDDGVNNPVSSEITVEIVDTGVPTLAPVPDKTILWPPNHKMVEITIEANANDNSGGSVTLSAGVSSDEPEDGLGDGDQSPDWNEPVIDQENGIITLQLRAERSGSGDGRVYTITITATDESGNSSQAQVEIIVPHDKRKK